MTALPEDLAFGPRAVYVEPADALVVADLHVGRGEDSLVEFPLGEREDIVDRLGGLLDRFGPETVVVAGDLLHSFSRLPDRIVDGVAAVRETVERANASLVVAPGNHDTMLDGVEGVVAEPAHRLADGTVVCHGHERPDADADRYLVGHEHPAIVIEGKKHPCFLYGPGVHRGSDVVMLPAFSRLARGTVINGMTGRDANSPLLSAIGQFRPIVYDGDADEALAFPPLRELREYL